MEARIDTVLPQEPAPGRREQRRQATRRELLQAGRRLFSERGLYEARVEDLTDFARIAKGTLYLHFRDKDDIICAVVEEAFTELRADAMGGIAARQRLRARAGGIALSHFRFLSRNEDWLRILHQARGLLLFQRRRRTLRAAFEKHIDWIAGQLAATSDGCALPVARRREMARGLFGAVSGIASMRALFRPPAGRPTEGRIRLRGLVDFVLGTIEPPGTRAPSRPERGLSLRR